VMISTTILAIVMVGTSPLYFVWLVSGLAWWSLFEYLFHRWGFHLLIFVHAHQLHHIYPSGYIGVSSLITSTLYVFGVGLSLSLGMPAMTIVQVGLSIGYLTYIFVHHQIHHGRFAGRYLNSVRARHNRHHQNIRCDFGVTTNFWDSIFGTQSGGH
jgi:sterol desaturase/sphingolipid hydroxylase (fatty acid hydroxylase superfamily)